MTSISTCKRCDRPTCLDCTIQTEVGTVCPECAHHHNVMKRQRPQLLKGNTVTQWILIVTITVSLAAQVMAWVGIPLWSYLAYAPIVGWKQPWRFLTVALVHGGFLHLGLNMFTLYIVGPSVERALGAWRFFALYVLSAIGGSIAVLAWVLVSPSSYIGLSVGASGAIFGLFAAIYVLQKDQGLDTRAIVVLLAINLGYGFIASRISWQAHLGGLIVGALVTWIMLRLGKPRANVTYAQQERTSRLAVGGLFIAEALIIAALYYTLFGILV